jgi:hypothetical protein
LQQCDVPNWEWFNDYGQRRLRDNGCAPAKLNEVAAPTEVDTTALVLVSGVVGGCACMLLVFLAVARRCRVNAEPAGGFVPLLGQ